MKPDRKQTKSTWGALLARCLWRFGGSVFGPACTSASAGCGLSAMGGVARATAEFAFLATTPRVIDLETSGIRVAW